MNDNNTYIDMNLPTIKYNAQRQNKSIKFKNTTNKQIVDNNIVIEQLFMLK